MTHFAVLAPEVNSARIYTGAGPGPMLAAAAAWDQLGVELAATATSFNSAVTGLTAEFWQGSASMAMAYAAAPYAAWLSAAGAQAEHTASQLRAAATTFEAAQAATVHPAVVAANRIRLNALIATNLLGQNTPAVAATEAVYDQLWAQDVTAMAGYHNGISAIAAGLSSWQESLQNLQGPIDNAIASLGLQGNNIGYGNAGTFGIGLWNTGDHNIGIANTGTGNIGIGNTGNGNFGIGNTGDRNIGYFNAGNWNVGFANTGNWNYGFGNPGNGNVGLLLTNEREVGIGGLATTVLIMGGTGLNPIPAPTHVSQIEQLFVTPEYPGYNSAFLVTPSKLFPYTGLHSLTFDASVNQGLNLLNTQIMTELAAGNHTVVLGYSQSATIATLEQGYLMSLPIDQRPLVDQLSFILLGNPSRPNGGFLSRLAGTYIERIGFTFYGANPYSLYPTTDYAIEYDGVSDFPQYLLNPFATTNAFAGMFFRHPTYSSLTASQIASGIVQPVSPSDTTSTYLLIPSDNLPLLDPIRWIPFVGNPVADLVQPSLKVLVDLGYDRTAYQDVPTSFSLGVAPPDTDWTAVTTALQQGALQGIRDATDALALPPPLGLGITLR
ncbi:MAG: PE-PPE domain-containing protein [Mycobacteriaceae bacterium]|nr:PE-PPE domain-containing protein [Mycobacteriaceae bacterium]